MLLKKPRQEKGKKKKVAQNVPVKQREDGGYEGYEEKDEVGSLTMLC